MGEVSAFRGFKVPRSTNAFVQSKSTGNRAFCETDLARSGLTPEDMQAAFDDDLLLPAGATAGYLIPYCDLNGREILTNDRESGMYRIRTQFPEQLKGPRYTQPTKEQLLARGLPAYIPYIHPAMFRLPSDVLICAEGEKKATCIIKYLGLPTFGIGGCHLWRDPTANEERGKLHPWIIRLIEHFKPKELVIVPDGDVTRYDICTAYSAFALAVKSYGLPVSILHPPDKIDDLLVREGAAVWPTLPRLSLNALIQPADVLIEQCDLAFKVTGKGIRQIHQHTSNITRLLTRHGAFPHIWMNDDKLQLMTGPDPAMPGCTEMEIANYFQHNLGLDRVTHERVADCIHAIALKNHRSPFLEKLTASVWDGVPRLETWMQRLWGVEDTLFSREVSLKWLISSCARIHKPGTKIDFMLITQGGQGVGKTSMPDVLFYNNALPIYGEHNDKDLHMLFHSALCIGFDELDSFSRKESSALLAMITRHTDPFRPPYGRAVITYPRRFVFYGCCNKASFLQHNPDGYRRFPVVHVPRLLDFKALEAERDQLWAEAWFRYSHENISYWEITAASAEAEKYVIPNVLEDRIYSWLEGQLVSKLSTVNQGILEFTMTQVLLGIDESMSTFIVRDVHAILQRIGATLHERTQRKPRHYTIKAEAIRGPTGPLGNATP